MIFIYKYFTWDNPFSASFFISKLRYPLRQNSDLKPVGGNQKIDEDSRHTTFICPLVKNYTKLSDFTIDYLVLDKKLSLLETSSFLKGLL